MVPPTRAKGLSATATSAFTLVQFRPKLELSSGDAGIAALAGRARRGVAGHGWRRRDRSRGRARGGPPAEGVRGAARGQGLQARAARDDARRAAQAGRARGQAARGEQFAREYRADRAAARARYRAALDERADA